MLVLSMDWYHLVCQVRPPVILLQKDYGAVISERQVPVVAPRVYTML
jgi:hypothetical protein